MASRVASRVAMPAIANNTVHVASIVAKTISSVTAVVDIVVGVDIDVLVGERELFVLGEFVHNTLYKV